MTEFYDELTELAWTEEHVVIASEQHTDVKLECDNLLKNKRRRKRIAKHMVNLIADEMPECDAIVTIANGANCLARQISKGLTKKLGREIVGIETKKVENEFEFKLVGLGGNVQSRRYENIVLVDDVFTYGTNAGKVTRLLTYFGGGVRGLATMFNRNQYHASHLTVVDTLIPVKSLIQKPISDWPANECSTCNSDNNLADGVSKTADLRL